MVQDRRNPRQDGVATHRVSKTPALAPSPQPPSVLSSTQTPKRWPGSGLAAKRAVFFTSARLTEPNLNGGGHGEPSVRRCVLPKRARASREFAQTELNLSAAQTLSHRGCSILCICRVGVGPLAAGLGPADQRPRDLVGTPAHGTIHHSGSSRLVGVRDSRGILGECGTATKPTEVGLEVSFRCHLAPAPRSPVRRGTCGPRTPVSNGKVAPITLGFRCFALLLTCSERQRRVDCSKPENQRGAPRETENHPGGTGPGTSRASL